MAEVMLDSNVLLDVLTEDPAWFGWSSRTLEECAQNHILVINPIIYAEVSIGFDRMEDLDAALPKSLIERRPIPLEAAFLAGKCFVKYRGHGGQKRFTLPDFFIGAQAEIMGWKIATRDHQRFKKYFPAVELVTP